jgi:Domain of unknown function (DUF6438)
MRYTALVAVTLGCASRSADPAPTRSSSAGWSTSADYAVTLYRSPCYGSCPMYSLAVTPDGTIKYEGRGNVRHIGTASARMDEARVGALTRELEAAGYFRLADRYRPSEAVCGRYVPDAPTVITSVRIGDRVKRIEHDQGCGSAPESLTVLESRIDEALGARRWTGR